MPIAQLLLDEFEIQAPITRRFLERLPEDKLAWKPHHKSMTAGQLAYHIAQTPGGVIELVRKNPMESHTLPSFPEPASVAEILDIHEKGTATVREVMPQFDDAAMNEVWRLAVMGTPVVAAPRAAFLRDVMFSHWYQHRGQFSVYLRLLNIPVPASWGPSADEIPAFLQKPQAA
jgi:uncharacterized damage-inducible protein DinB